MSNIDLIEISLVIDDNTTLTFKFNSSQTDNDTLLKLSNDVAQTYNLPDKAKTKLYQCLLNEVNKVINNQTISTKNNSSELKQINEHVVNRLYYQSTKKQKERDEYHKQIRNMKEEEEMVQCSFTPNINKKSYLIASNRNKKESIGDKLYSQRKNKMNQRNTMDMIQKYVNDNNYNNNVYNDEEKYINNDFDVNDIVNMDDDNNEEQSNINNTNINNNNIKNIHFNSYSLNHSLNQRLNNIMTNNNKTKPLSIQPSYIPKKQKSFNTFNTLNHNNTNTNNNNDYPKRSATNINKSSLCPNHPKRYERLYSDHKQKQNNLLQQQNDYYEQHYTFEPVISKGSQQLMKNRNESTTQFYSRLSSTKTQSKPTLNKETQLTSENTKRRPQSSYKTRSSKKTLLTEEDTTPGYLNKRNLKDVKSEENSYKNIQQVQSDRKRSVKYYQQNVNSNIERYKLNQIKDIYDLLFKDGNDNINFEHLYKENVPKHIIDKVVKPACYMINDRNLEFTFQNFYLIAGELLNKFFI